MKKKIVIYGGAFNPPHIGHAILIETILRLFHCDGIWLTPSADRLDKKINTPGTHRKKMLEIIIEEFFPQPKIPILVSTIELDRPKLTTTYETKLELEKNYPGCEFYFPVGSDIAGDIESKWVNGKELYRSTDFIVFPKDGSELFTELPPNFKVLDKDKVVGVSVSSTFIRKLLSDGYSGLPYLPPAISQYIKRNNLYM